MLAWVFWPVVHLCACLDGPAGQPAGGRCGCSDGRVPNLQSDASKLALPDACAKLDAANGNKYTTNKPAQARRRLDETTDDTADTHTPLEQAIDWILDIEKLGLVNIKQLANATFRVGAQR